ncbi:MAG TPA: tetratricopeptide repeat protein [Myxococcota bacterium]|nr:tetratricopeptide repeat protein [Myxococcota bacterium]HRY94305.1 tetratricopeptide repeat protein [Myxococcota bacterium]HSA23796.1 tetratricopeptide repeat protein [Myxococcota bacterium]
MEDRIKELLRLGRDAYRKKEFSRAESYLVEVLEHHETFADLHNMLGVIYHDRGLFSKAQKHFERALAINPNYTEASLNLAVTYNDLGRYEDAKRIYANALQRSQSKPGEMDSFVKGKVSNMYADIGEVYHSSGMFLEAAQEFRKALALAPGFVDIRLRLALALRDLGQTEEAVGEFRRILQDRPAFLQARVHLGVALHALGKTAEAILEWQEVLKQDPGNRSCQMYLKLLGQPGGVGGATP